ncbi:MAG TPA: histidinol dehydrogenase [Aeromonadales bacterium]|nr:histidinol dehydrogenase [Aeromonadales bacterium]
MIIEAKDWQRPHEIENEALLKEVEALISQIKISGDEKIIQLSQQFDGFSPEIIKLKTPESYQLESKTLAQLKIAASRIEKFAKFQMHQYKDGSFEDEYGCYGQKVLPIEKIAAYIPGGRFPLASTALMTLIPAKIARCSSRLALSPSDHPAILAAASLAGATQFIKIGGVQAIAAAAFGSKFNQAVDMIVGPGNAYVNTAKALLQSKVKIDSQAGPSELLIISNNQVNPKWLIADMKAQAEHDPMALSVLISWNKTFLEQIEQLLLSNKDGMKLLHSKQIQLVLSQDSNEAIQFSNHMGAEHLMLCSDEIDSDNLTNYGALFIGKYSAVALGDYCAGPNHTLPTSGFSRQRGGLQVGDFLRILSFQNIKSRAYPALANTAIALANLESLPQHKNSLESRCE